MSAWTIFVLVLGYIFLTIIAASLFFVLISAFAKWVFDQVDVYNYRRKVK